MAKISFLCCHLLMAFCLFYFAANSRAEGEMGVFELKRGDFSVKLTNWGATVLSVILPDKNGKLDDVVLGFQTLDGYKNDSTYFGALVGRVANRIGGAQFTLNGVHYNLTPNEGPNILHGGPKGFSEHVWTVQSYKEDSHITFTLHSPDGDEGFPGELAVSVTYLLIETNKLGIKMQAKPLTKPTPVNLASHTYWNLAGHNSGNILSHTLQLFASRITPVDSALIPTGQITDVHSTPYDFLQPRPIGSRFNELTDGYDINYALDDTGNVHFHKVAVVEESKSGRKMELWSNQVGVQFYTSNMLGRVEGKDGAVYENYAGLCLETQGFPDAVNHPNFPSQIVNPGETYKHIMVYRFTAH
ncbi:Aldose 1-epimerase [Bertholletia excelsa]